MFYSQCNGVATQQCFVLCLRRFLSLPPARRIQRWPGHSLRQFAAPRTPIERGVTSVSGELKRGSR
jgi:hypothetical protein